MTRHGDTEISGHMAHGDEPRRYDPATGNCSGCGVAPLALHLDECPIAIIGPAGPKSPEPHPTGRQVTIEPLETGAVARDVSAGCENEWAFSTLGEALEFAKRYLEG